MVMHYIQNKQQLSVLKSNFFAHDPKAKRMLLLSVRERIPAQLATLDGASTDPTGL